jgi:hypothetical protein
MRQRADDGRAQTPDRRVIEGIVTGFSADAVGPEQPFSF